MILAQTDPGNQLGAHEMESHPDASSADAPVLPMVGDTRGQTIDDSFDWSLWPHDEQPTSSFARANRLIPEAQPRSRSRSPVPAPVVAVDLEENDFKFDHDGDADISLSQHSQHSVHNVGGRQQHVAADSDDGDSEGDGVEQEDVPVLITTDSDFDDVDNPWDGYSPQGLQRKLFSVKGGCAKYKKMTKHLPSGPSSLSEFKDHTKRCMDT
eukprot:3944047-Pyramimonas_sp.AAC.1